MGLTFTLKYLQARLGYNTTTNPVLRKDRKRRKDTSNETSGTGANNRDNIAELPALPRLRFNDIHDRDGLKHISLHSLYRLSSVFVPPGKVHGLDEKPSPGGGSGDGSAARVLYVFDDPLEAVLSIFRRDFAAFQMQKLWGSNAMNRTMRRALTSHGLEGFLRAVAAAGRDLMGIENQVRHTNIRFANVSV